MNAEDQLAAVGRDELRLVAEGALGRAVEEMGGWRYAPLRASLGPATGWSFRVWGTARVGGGDGRHQDTEWSAVLKVLRPPVGTRHDLGARQPEHWVYWRRE